MYFNFFLLLTLKRRREEEREGENHPCERETLIGCILHIPQPGTEPTTQACTVTRNQTHHILVCWMMPDQLEPHQPRCEHEFERAHLTTYYWKSWNCLLYTSDAADELITV